MKQLGLVMIVTLLMTWGAGAVSAQENPEEMCFQRGGIWDASLARCIIRGSVEIEVATPLNYVDYSIVSGILNHFIDSTRAEFLGNAILSGAFTQLSAGGWVLNITYEEYQFSPTLVSVVFQVYEYTGGANGFSYYRAFVLDLVNEERVVISDVFQPGVLYLDMLVPLVRQSIAAQFNLPVDDPWLLEGTAPLATNYLNFALTPTELLVYFDEYQVAPGAAGAITARVPLVELSAILIPPYGP